MIFDHLPERALGIKQPWAHGIIHLGKPVENRKWNTNFRGPVCVHASASWSLREYLSAKATASAAGVERFPTREELRFGGIIGTVEIVDVVTKLDSPWFFGPYGFILANPTPCDFIPVSGALGFFHWRKRLL